LKPRSGGAFFIPSKHQQNLKQSSSNHRIGIRPKEFRQLNVCSAPTEETDMNNLSKYTLLALVIVSMLGNTACTSMKTAYASQEAVLANKIGPGDKVKLRYPDGSTEAIRVSSIGEQQIEGMADDGRTVVANYEEILSVDYKKVEVAKTAGAVVGGAVVATLVLGAIAVGAAAGLMAY
jgi:hypothetical protein